ncbi:hypothetical protein GWI33_001653 [Rhynchophorus ferrugineus]|uniref:Ionotropic glutamate receptor C-terminal domain-containing protein n=1 Tax=Rhynchophorus ferrugineus TaxID=354439 RepID=A0A834IZ17_RHYFE|nr:hypothetical protein GWI33_001653 [Rhynchophorus ferrugineus]
MTYSDGTEDTLLEGSEGRQMNYLIQQTLWKHYNKCTIKVAALPYERFVNDGNSGFEIDILKEIGNTLNISFNINVRQNSSFNLGQKALNGTWTGLVRSLYNDAQLIIGNIAPDKIYLNEFIFSVGYFSEKIVWAVPIAAQIPRWRVLTMIFSMQIWMICVAVVFAFGLLFRISKEYIEYQKFSTFEKCLLAAFEVVIAIPLHPHPVGHITRIFFISLAVFAIIMNSVYTSSLVYYLQGPVREHQITTTSEIIKSGLIIGGSQKYQHMFNNGDTKNAFTQMILKNFEFVNNSIDSYTYWLEQVGKNRSLATITIKLCATYLLSTNNPIVTEANGQPKIFILPKQIISQNVGIMMKKGNLLQEDLNVMIQRIIIEAGIGNMFKRRYLGPGQFDENQSNKNPSQSNRIKHNSPSSKLTTHHVEGAFTILGLGYLTGVISFFF